MRLRDASIVLSQPPPTHPVSGPAGRRRPGRPTPGRSGPADSAPRPPWWVGGNTGNPGKGGRKEWADAGKIHIYVLRMSWILFYVLNTGSVTAALIIIISLLSSILQNLASQFEHVTPPSVCAQHTWVSFRGHVGSIAGLTCYEIAEIQNKSLIGHFGAPELPSLYAVIHPFIHWYQPSYLTLKKEASHHQAEIWTVPGSSYGWWWSEILRPPSVCETWQVCYLFFQTVTCDYEGQPGGERVDAFISQAQWRSVAKCVISIWCTVDIRNIHTPCQMLSVYCLQAGNEKPLNQTYFHFPWNKQPGASKQKQPHTHLRCK